MMKVQHYYQSLVFNKQMRYHYYFKERFESYISPLIKNEENIKLSSRPKEGDLIYFPLGDRLFEIKYVEHEKPFYQLQKNLHLYIEVRTLPLW